MKILKKFLTAGVAASALCGASAYAADLPAKAPYFKAEPVSVYNWTGLYIGGHVGGAWDHTDWTFLQGTFFGLVDGNQISFAPHSWLGGAQVGFNYQIDRFVVGIEGTWSATDLKERIVGPFGSQQSNFALDDETTKIKNLYTIAGRAGVTFNQFLIYGKGGWAGGQVELSATSPVGGITLWNPGKKTQSGWVAGVGAEYMVTPNIIAGIEYDHVDLGSSTFSAFNTGFNTELTEVSAKTRVDSVVGRLSYKFNPF